MPIADSRSLLFNPSIVLDDSSFLRDLKEQMTKWEVCFVLSPLSANRHLPEIMMVIESCVAIG